MCRLATRPHDELRVNVRARHSLADEEVLPGITCGFGV
jgi:hypothetical protein